MTNRGNPDYWLLLLVFLLTGFGLLMVFSSSATFALERYHSPLYFTVRQSCWAGLGLVSLLILMNVPYRSFLRWNAALFVVTLVLLVLVLLVGTKIHGHRSWFGVGSFGIQPTELAKLLTVLYLSALISKKGEGIRNFKKGLLPPLIILGLVLFLIMLEPDIGSSLVLLLSAIIVIFIGGAKGRHLLFIALAAAPVGVYILTAHTYRVQRFTSFLHPWDSPDGASYQLVQSLYAFGHGGIWGVGIGNSIEKNFYLPEAHTDFIFSIIGEEFGFVRATLFLVLYAIMIWRGITLSLRCRDRFGTLLGVGIISLTATQAFINMGGVTGALPVTGVPLPLISYGGSSLLFTLAGLGIVLNISRESDRAMNKQGEVLKPIADLSVGEKRSS